jgi:2-hydroxychromene-2-carboxylate isomerase
MRAHYVGVELWFDFSCPYAYLASQVADALANRVGLTIDWQPMLLGGVFRGIGAGDGPMATLTLARAVYNLRDMGRWADVLGVPFRMPDAHPMRTVRALRVLLALPHARWPHAIHALFAAYWQRAEDITRDDVIASALRAAGIAEAELAAALAAADTETIKDELRRRTEQAIARGVFGAPAWIVGGQLCWGQDRLAWVEAIARGWKPDTDVRAEPPPTGAPAVPGATLEVFCDAASPFSYLGLTQLPRVLADAGAGVTARIRPILVGALFKTIGTANAPLLAFPESKRRYMGLEMQRWARWWGMPFQIPAKFPQRTVTAQRLIWLARDHGFDAQYRLALGFARAMWAERRDLEDAETVRGVLADAGLPAERVAEMLEHADEPATKAGLIAETKAAQDAGAFGAPTWVVDAGKGPLLFWGQDRLELVARALAGWRPSRE